MPVFLPIWLEKKPGFFEKPGFCVRQTETLKQRLAVRLPVPPRRQGQPARLDAHPRSTESRQVDLLNEYCAHLLFQGCLVMMAEE